MTMYAINKSGLKPRTPTNNSFTVSQNDIEKQITNRLHYYKTLKDKLDTHATKASSIALRKRWLEKQKKMNYQNEYDRVRSEIARQTVFRGGTSLSSLEKRKSDLEKLGAIAIGTVSH